MFKTLFLIMLFLHIVDDYYLQGILASLKQKSWWEDRVENLESSIYDKDYLMALFIHGFSWSFLTSVPIIFLYGGVSLGLFAFIIINGLIHSFIDDLKANKKKINLITDQLLHILQILIMLIVFLL